MFRSIVRPAAAALTVAALVAAPAAVARPADQGTQSPPAVAHLTAGQLRAVDGHQPSDPPATYSTPARVTPPQHVQPGGTPATTWIAGALALLALGALGVGVTRTMASTHRRHLPSA